MRYANPGTPGLDAPTTTLPEDGNKDIFTLVATTQGRRLRERILIPILLTIYGST
jgi:hypothetical protein